MSMPAIVEPARKEQGDVDASGPPGQLSTWLQRVIRYLPSLSDDPTRPSHIALRTYALAQFLSLTPSLVPTIIAVVRAKDAAQRTRAFATLRRVLAREFRHDGFAFSMTLAVAGGAALNQLWGTYASKAESVAKWDATGALKSLLTRCTPIQRAFISNALASAVGYALLRSGRNRNIHLKKRRAKDSLLPMTVPQAQVRASPCQSVIY